MGTAASLSVRISANTSDFDSSLKKLTGSLNQTGSQLQSIGSRLSAAITLPLAGAAVAATKFASDYEASTTKLVTLSGISTDQMRQMRQAMLDLGPAVGVGPQKLADAMLVVTSTGFQGADAMNILTSAAQSSAVGMGDTKDVARTLTAALSAYGTENLTAAQAADVLYQTVVEGGAEATDLAGALGPVIGIAAELGVSFQEVGAYIATYTRLGVNADVATVALRGALATIMHPSAEARDALASVGMSADSLRQSIKENGLGEALIDLLGKFHGNSDAIAAVFGNVRALAGIMGTAGAQAESYREILDHITNSTGNLDKAFEETKKTFAFQWSEFRAQAEKLAITLGTQLLPAATKLLEAVKPLGEWAVKAVQWFAALPTPIQTGAIAIAGFFAALGPAAYAVGTILRLGGAFTGLMQFLGPVTGGVLTMGTAWTSLVSIGTGLGQIVTGIAGAFGLWAVPIGAVVAGLGYLLVKTGALQEAFSGFWSVATSVSNLFVDLSTILVKGVIYGIETLWGWISKWGIWSEFAGGVNTTRDALANLVPDSVKSSIQWVVDKISWLLGKFADVRAGIHDLATMGFGSSPEALPLPASPLSTSDHYGAGALSGPIANALAAQQAADEAFRAGETARQQAAEAERKKAQAAAEAWQKVNDEISGKAAIAAADQWMKHVDEVGGVTHLTQKATHDLANTLSEAIEGYALLGRVAPQAMLDTLAATMGLQNATRGLSSLSGIGTPIDTLLNETAALQGVNMTPGSGVPLDPFSGMIGQPIGNEQQPGAFDPFGGFIPGTSLGLEGAPSGQSFWSQLTGSQGYAALLGQLTRSFGGNTQATGYLNAGLGILGSGQGGAGLLNTSGVTGGLAGAGAGIGLSLLSKAHGTWGNVGAGALTGASVGTMIMPGIGTAIGAGVGALAGYIKSIMSTAGRDAVQNFVTQTFGSFDALHARLNELHDQLKAAGFDSEQLWISLTQGVGRGNASQAAAAIQQISDALAKAGPTMAEQAAAMGFKTNDELKKIADQSVKLWEYMRDSGKYSAEAVQAAWENAQQALSASGDKQAQAAMDAKAKISELDEQIKGLQASVDAEAPEETMGVIEKQQRDQLEALKKQREDAQKQYDELAQHIGTSIGDSIKDALKGPWSIEVGGHVRLDNGPGGSAPTGGEAPEAPPVDVPGMASGGIVRARPGGTLVNVGEGGMDEAIVPLNGGSRGMSTIIIEADGRTLAEVLVPYIPGEVQRLGLA